jgi:hypothetical protein
MYSFGDDMRERFEQILRAYPEVFSVYENTQKMAIQQTADLNDYFKKLREGKKPENGVAFDNTLTPTDQLPVSVRPVDVYVDVPDQVAVIDENDEVTYVEQPRTWSANALKYGLSLAIRLDELWPNAIKGFMRNPLFGSGFATLNKKEFLQFTEAESTDNNFLRTLGETGLLGFVTFYGAVTVLLVILYINQKDSKDQQLKTANLAFIAASIGLLLNASYIDVFASSKVAFTYWALAGAILAYNQLAIDKHVKKTTKKSS